MKTSVATEALSRGTPAGAHQGPPAWASSMMGLLTANAGRGGEGKQTWEEIKQADAEKAW